MKAQEIELKKFLTQGDVTFTIPVYQRNYDWKIGNCRQLFSDILAITPDYNAFHFIGTICHKMEGRHKSIIIDGQQRITTIMLLLKGIADLTDNQKLKEKIVNQYLMNQYYNTDTKLKLKPIKKDQNVFQKVMREDSRTLFFNYPEKCSNVYQNYDEFLNLLSNAVNDGYKLEDIEDAIERLTIVELEIQDENPQVIFESLNSTGLDLTNTDLLRNYLLMSLDYKSQEELYEYYWMQIEENVSTEYMEDFISYYLILKRKNNKVSFDGKVAQLNKNNLYFSFKKYFPIDRTKLENIRNLLKDMYKYSIFYTHIIHPNDDAIGRKIYELVTILEQKDVAIVLMYLLDKKNEGIISDTNLIDCINSLITYVFRCSICKKRGMSTQSAVAVIKHLDEVKTGSAFNTELMNALNQMNGIYGLPKDAEFKGCLSESLYGTIKTSKCKYLLWKINQYINPKEVIPFDQGTIEHIIPRTLTVEWRDFLNKTGDLVYYDTFVNTLGNLTLTGYNSELSNKTFNRKKVEYEKSSYAITRELTQYTQFDRDTIEKRANRLITLTLQIWSIPKEFNNVSLLNTVTEYNFNVNPELFTGTKPDAVFICGVKIPVSSWKDAAIAVTKELYGWNPVVFYKMIYSNDKYLNANFSRNAFSANDTEIDKNNLYFNTVHSTVEMIKIIRHIIEFFEGEEDIIMSNEITFTLKHT